MFERSIEAVATFFGNGVGWLAEHGVLFLIFAALWLAVIAGLLLDQELVSEVWSTIGTWPLPVQLLAWLLFLPVMAGLWVWHTDWALLIRVVVLVALAVGTMVVFWPRRAAKDAEAG
jgi:hypothetical protein